MLLFTQQEYNALQSLEDDNYSFQEPFLGKEVGKQDSKKEEPQEKERTSGDKQKNKQMPGERTAYKLNTLLCLKAK